MVATPLSSDEDYDPRDDAKKRRLDTSKAGGNKAGGTGSGNRLSGGAGRAKAIDNDKGTRKVASRVGMVVKKLATSAGPIGASVVTAGLAVSTSTAVVTPTIEVSNLTS